MASSLLRTASWAVALPFGLWAAFLVLAVNPTVQRHILYAHRIVPWWQDTNKPQAWGFAKNQVTPFYLKTADGEKIHAWHILPLPIYQKHDKAIRAQPTGLCPDFTATESFRLLHDDPEAKLVIYFHGNAGHLPTTVRAPSFHALTDTSSLHVLAIDYRGFGLSSGSPSEEGLIRDASAAVDFALKTAGIPPSRVVLLGHSLGTAVAVAVAEKYGTDLGIDFAGIVLVASFSSLPTMLSGYSIAGVVPVFGPLRMWPHVRKWLFSFIIDRWLSTKRLRSLVNNVYKQPGRHLHLSLIHAADDHDIPSAEDDKLFAAFAAPLLGYEVSGEHLAEAKAARTVSLGHDAFVSEWRQDNVVVRQERFPHGGHNNIMMYAPVIGEVMRAFDDAQKY